MNIFLTDPCPRVCAEALDDKRVNKMTVETAQLLSTSLRLLGVQDELIYRATHVAHPCSKWAARNRSNFNWLVEHGLWLANEYEFRTDRRRVHKSESIILRCADLRANIPDAGPLVLDPLNGGFNSSGFDVGDIFLNYKLCMVNKWRYLDGAGGADGKAVRSRKPIWTYRGAPPFKRVLWNVDMNNPPLLI